MNIEQLTKKDLKSLESIKAASTETGFCHLPINLRELNRLEDFIETNREIMQDNFPAIRLTDVGLKAIQVNGTLVPEVIMTQAHLTFEIDDGVPMPEIIGRGRKGVDYPFIKLLIGQSFHVPMESKKISASVSAANKKFSDRRFSVRAVTANDIRGKGCRVFRVV